MQGARPRIRLMPPEPGDVERTWADVALARRELGWEPTTDLDTGLGKFLEWLVAQPAAGAGTGDRR